jgi:hypothetical protein
MFPHLYFTKPDEVKDVDCHFYDANEKKQQENDDFRLPSSLQVNFKFSNQNLYKHCNEFRESFEEDQIISSTGPSIGSGEINGNILRHFQLDLKFNISK